MNPNFIYRLGSRPYAYELSGDELESVDLGSDDSRKFPKTVLSLPEDWESSNPLSYIDVKVGPKSFVTLTTGVNMIVGPTASGKTSFLNRIFARLSDVEDLDVNFVNYSEPTRDAVVDEVELANATALALLTKDPSVVLIDSWREYAYSHTAGATGKGGMDMGLFARLTHLDIAALKTDTIVVGVMNPLTTDAEALDFYVKAAAGSITTLIFLPEPGVVEYTTRGGDPNRNRGMVRFNWPERDNYNKKSTQSTMVFTSMQEPTNGF